jgi:predicted acylesterase/phospholipase RssA
MSLPGILPPATDGSRLLVDGGVLDNVPEEEMLDFCGGRVIAVDVSGGAPMKLDYEYEDMPSVSRLVRDRLNPWAEATRVPTIVDVMVRTATVSNASQQPVEDTVELVLRPPIQRFGLLQFEAIDEIARVAAEHARERVSGWLGTSRGS